MRSHNINCERKLNIKVIKVWWRLQRQLPPCFSPPTLPCFEMGWFKLHNELQTPGYYRITFSACKKQDAKFHSLFISVRRSTCFRRVFRPSSGAQNCTYNVRYLSGQYLTLYVQFWVPDDGRKTRLKHVERLIGIKKLWNVASCWLYAENILAMHGPMNVKC